MKKLLSLFAVLFLASSLKASALGDFWADLKSKSDLQLGDNVAPATFYDVKKGVPADERIKGGVQTTLYSYRIVDLNFALLKDVQTGDATVPGFSVGLRFEKYLGMALSKVAPILGENVDSPLFQRLRLGGYYAKDFKNHKESYGVAAYWVFSGKTEE